MNWFYALNNQQAGPVDDAELARLVQTGVISGQTLIWHSGLPSWQTYDAVRLAATASTPAVLPVAAVLAPGEVSCSQCGRAFPADEVVRVGAYDVCAECKPVLIQKMRQGALSGDINAIARPFAGFGIRLGAAILDGIILTPLFVVIYAAYFYLFVFRYANLSQPQNTSSFILLQSVGVAFGLIMTLIMGVYSAYCVSRWGATPGKRICELRIVRGDGSPLTFGRAFGRYCAKAMPRVVPLLGLIYSVLDYVFIFSDPERRALHDQICDTRVVHHPKK